ncbi:hypothetical protein ACFCYN_04490 [Gottfriedia sp. NPDC056225]|uniref:hypothetical protein n=1 Tax=Gottfriedia sp. NPDC056225 TaxID=3345751 RepID=UPI0035E1B987
MEKKQEKTTFIFNDVSFSTIEELPLVQQQVLVERLTKWRSKLESLVIESYLSTTYPQCDLKIEQ